jgi:hypothetical protein
MSFYTCLEGQCSYLQYLTVNVPMSIIFKFMFFYKLVRIIFVFTN